MGYYFRFTVLPPIDTEAFDAWHDGLGEDVPCADFSEGGSELHVHGSYVRSSGFLAEYWPALRDWVRCQGSKITFDSGDHDPAGFEKTPEKDDA